MKTPKTKICPKCGKRKKLELFHRRKSSVNGREGRCKKCVSEYSVRYRHKNKKCIQTKKKQRRAELRKANWKPYCVPLEKVCTKCGKKKKMKMFCISLRCRDGRNNKCKACAKAYRQSHKEEIKAYRQSHKEEIKAYYQSRKDKIDTINKAWALTHKKERKGYSKTYNQRQSIQITDVYVRQSFCCNRNSILTRKDIPQELVEAKREYIKLTRKLRKAQ